MTEYADEQRLREQVKARSIPSERQFAIRHGIDRNHLNHFMNGRRVPPQALLKLLGYERVVMYRRKS